MSGTRINMPSGKDLAEEVARRLKPSMRNVAQEIVEVARDNVPRKSGTLARSIEFVEVGDGLYIVRTRTGYGGFVELGTFRMAARPYMAPATQQVLKRVLNKTASEILGEFG